jgi:hypothetical protein
MKKLWLLVFPICMLLSCLTGCRPPVGGAISTWSSTGKPVAPYIDVEEGGNQHFLANYPFKIYWCNDASCTTKEPLGPCTKQVDGTSSEKADGHLRYVGTCVISKGASGRKDYRYIFRSTDEKRKIADTPVYGFPDNLQPCNPRCSKGLHSQ